jgi:hypothetical protein
LWQLSFARALQTPHRSILVANEDEWFTILIVQNIENRIIPDIFLFFDLAITIKAFPQRLHMTLARRGENCKEKYQYAHMNNSLF